jgi:hypothetical protein
MIVVVVTVVSVVVVVLVTITVLCGIAYNGARCNNLEGFARAH